MRVLSRFAPTRPAPEDAHAHHSYAVPLSDGHHLMFTDNETSSLCLGADTPAGSVQRLSRKVLLECPVHTDIPREDQLAPPPVCAALNNLEDGARIVALYGEHIVLFSVPVDVLRYSTAEQESTIQDPAVSFEELDFVEILRHPTSNAGAFVRQSSSSDASVTPKSDKLNMKWVHYVRSMAASDHPVSLDGLWPIVITGLVVGLLPGTQTLSVQECEAEGLVVWAFSSADVAKA